MFGDAALLDAGAEEALRHPRHELSTATTAARVVQQHGGDQLMDAAPARVYQRRPDRIFQRRGAAAPRRGEIIQRCTDEEYGGDDWEAVTYDKAAEKKAAKEAADCTAARATVKGYIVAQDQVLNKPPPFEYPEAVAGNVKSVEETKAAYAATANWNVYQGGLPLHQWVVKDTLDKLLTDTKYHTSPNTKIYTDAGHRNDAFNPLRLPLGHLLKDEKNFHVPTMTDGERTTRTAQRAGVVAWEQEQATANLAKNALTARSTQMDERIAYLGKVKEGSKIEEWKKAYFTPNVTHDNF